MVPHMILESPNITRLWAKFKYINEDKMSVDNSIITIYYNNFKLIKELRTYASVEPKPLVQLNREYEELLNIKDEEEDL